MEKVKTFCVYNLLNANGDKLKLSLGYVVDERGTPNPNGNYGLRWRFSGKNIPMPVRSGYWFNGFPEAVMLDWLKGNGWYPHTKVNMNSGCAVVFELPSMNGKGNEIPLHVESALIHAVRLLWANNLRVKATSLYKHIKGGTLYQATEAVKEIVDHKVEY